MLIPECQNETKLKMTTDFVLYLNCVTVHVLLMLPAHEKQQHNNYKWGNGLGMKYSDNRPVSLNESLVQLSEGGGVTTSSPLLSSPGVQVTVPQREVLTLLQSCRSQYPERGLYSLSRGHNPLKEGLREFRLVVTMATHLFCESMGA